MPYRYRRRRIGGASKQRSHATTKHRAHARINQELIKCGPGFTHRRAYCVQQKCIAMNKTGLMDWRTFFANFRNRNPTVPYKHAQHLASVEWRKNKPKVSKTAVAQPIVALHAPLVFGPPGDPIDNDPDFQEYLQEYVYTHKYNIQYSKLTAAERSQALYNDARFNWGREGARIKKIRAEYEAQTPKVSLGATVMTNPKKSGIHAPTKKIVTPKNRIAYEEELSYLKRDYDMRQGDDVPVQEDDEDDDEYDERVDEYENALAELQAKYGIQ